MFGLRWPWSKKENEVTWKYAPIPKDFNKSQLDCVSNAKWHYQEMKLTLKSTGKISSSRVTSCFWYIIFSHFKNFTDLYSGYSLDMTVPRVIERTHSAMLPVLLPKLEEVIRCEDEKQKELLTYQYFYILMATLFDSTDAFINYDVLREVLEVNMLDAKMRDFTQSNINQLLEPLGFKPYYFKEYGQDYVAWYWPNQ